MTCDCYIHLISLSTLLLLSWGLEILNHQLVVREIKMRGSEEIWSNIVAWTVPGSAETGRATMELNATKSCTHRSSYQTCTVSIRPVPLLSKFQCKYERWVSVLFVHKVWTAWWKMLTETGTFLVGERPDFSCRM